MLDHPRLIDQIAKLERRTGRLGKDARLYDLIH
jgi:hypothetical protein